MNTTNQKAGANVAAQGGAPFDTGALLERCMGNAKIALMVLEKLAMQLPGDVKNLTASTATGDCKATASVAHALKGAAGTVAAGTLRELAAAMEQGGRANDLERVRTCLEELTREVDRCLNHLPVAKAELSGSRA